MSEKLLKFITAEETLDLRSRVLRPHQNIELCKYEEDTLPTTFHLGILFNNKVICNGTFMLQSHKKFNNLNHVYRLRGMATEPSFQKQGLGQKIILAAEAELIKRNCDLLWFNARVSAEGFYRKLGYIAIEEIFEIPTIGPHKIMYRKF